MDDFNEKLSQVQQENHSVGYKIVADKRYRIFKTQHDDKSFYSIQITQKNYDGTISKYYRPVIFKKGIELHNLTDIIIHKGYENLRSNKKDPYNPISIILITEFEIIPNKEHEENDAYAEFQRNLNADEVKQNITNVDLPF